MRRTKIKRAAALFVCTLLALTSHAQEQPRTTPATTSAQSADDISGRYEGTGKSRKYGNLPISVEIRFEKGNITGTMGTPLGDINIPSGSYRAGKLNFRLENYDDEGTVTAEVKNGVLVGEFVGFDDSGTLELKRTGPAKPPVDTRPVLSLSKEKWREDLRVLAQELPKKHKNAFHHVKREEFERAVAELDARIPALEDSEIVVGLSRLTAMIGDGHTSLGWRWLYPQVPLTLYWYGRDLRVRRTVPAYRRALGARVVKIGNVPVAEALARSQPYISQAESEGFVQSTSADILTSPAFLHAVKLAPKTTHARYTFEDARGRRFTLDIGARATNTKVAWLDAERKTPLYRQKWEEPLSYTYLPEHQTLFVNFKAYPRRSTFAKFSKELFDFIDKQKPQRVVIDLRQNGGGDFTKGRDFIVSQIKKREAVNRRGHLFIIIGRWTYSAGMSNAADFRKETKATLVGEPTGARANGYQENRGFTLPNSHLHVSYSTEYYKFQDEDGSPVMPDKRIDPDWTSYRAGRDPVLEWILTQPQN